MNFFGFVLISCLSFYCACAYDMTPAEIQQILDAHNNVRSSWGVNVPLVWDATIASNAKSYSDQCIWGHSGAANLGENIGYKGFSNPIAFPYASVTGTVDDWNAEVKDWDCKTNSCAGTCGHFTQNIWKSTTKIGCGLSPCVFQGFKSQYLVCRYSTPGNYNGEHPLGASSSCPGSPPPKSTPSSTPTKSTPTSTPTKNTGSYSGCKVSCNSVATTCSATPQYLSNGVYCKCLSEPMLWGVSNGGTTACPFWPPNVPIPPSYEKCKANFNGKSVLCTGYPSQGYCPCDDPQGYSWPVTNLNTQDCTYTSSMAVSDVSASGSDGTLSTEQWIGICVGIVVVAVVVVVVIIIIMKKRESEHI